MYAIQEHTPFHALISPHQEEIRRDTLKWAFRFRLVSQVENTTLHELTARCYPGLRREVLQVINDWATWMTVLEQFLEQFPDQRMCYARDVVALLYDSAVPDHRANEVLFTSLLDLWERVQNFASFDWMLRFANQMADYFNAHLMMPLSRMTSDYIHHRRRHGWVEMWIGWGSLEEPVDLFHRQVDDDFFAIIGDIVCWTQDLILYDMRNPPNTNLVTLLQRDYDLPLHEAFELTESMIADRIDDYLRLAKLFPSHPSLDTFRWLIHGHLDWVALMAAS